MTFFLARFVLALAALVPPAEGSLGLESTVIVFNSSSKVEWSASEANLIEFGSRHRPAVRGFDGRLEMTATADRQRDTVTRTSLGVTALHSQSDLEAAVRTPTALRLWAGVFLLFEGMVAVAVAFRISGVLSGWQSRRLRTTAIRPDQARPPHVLVYVRGSGKMLQCDAQSTVGAMREEMGVPLDAVILLVPGGRELDDEMRVGAIVKEGPMTVEVRCRGVGGGLFGLFQNNDEALRDKAADGNIDEIRRLLAAGADTLRTSTEIHRCICQLRKAMWRRARCCSGRGPTSTLQTSRVTHRYICQPPTAGWR